MLLDFTKFRELLLNSIPVPLKIEITAGIGLFIAFLGLRMSGIVVPDEETYVAFGDVTVPMTALAIIGIFLTLILTARNVRGSLFIGMFVTAIIAYFLGMLEINGILSLPPSPVFFDFDLAGVFTHGLYGVVFAFLLVTIFDTTGTMIGVAEQAGLMKDGHLPKASAALTADAVASTVGAGLGSTPSSAYVESSSGVAAGGRTGLTLVVLAVLFIVALFFSPIVAAIANVPAITAPALILVGSYMMNGLSKVRWNEFDEAFPTFTIIPTMPLTSSIATGIAMGFIIYPLLKVASGKAKTVPAIIYIFGIIFAIQLVFFPMH